MHPQRTLNTVPDDELLRRLGELVSHSRRVEADLVSHIGEVEKRKLYAREACPSMFVYCTERLHLSEAAAYLRITVARAARKHPHLLTMLADGRLHLSGIAKLVPHLTRENRDSLLLRATHLSKRRIVELVAELLPRPDAPSVMRKLPRRQLGRVSSGVELVPGGVATSTPPKPSWRDVELGPDGVEACGSPTLAVGPFASPRPSRHSVVEPLSPTRYKVQFTASAELHDKLQRLSALMRSQVPDGDLAAIIEYAVTEKLERLEARRYAQTSAPRKGLSDTDTTPTSRHIPAAVRRAVRERDGDRCRYVDERGRRCSEQGRLEFHHRHPFGMGGDHSLANIGLLCPSHNRYVAERDYGQAVIRGKLSRPERPTGSDQ
jgi:hypothetical protein